MDNMANELEDIGKYEKTVQNILRKTTRTYQKGFIGRLLKKRIRCSKYLTYLRKKPRSITVQIINEDDDKESESEAAFNDHLVIETGSEKDDQFENPICDFREAESNSNKGSPAKCNTNNNDYKDCNGRTENQDEIEINFNSSKVKDAVINVGMPNTPISKESASGNTILLEDCVNILGNFCDTRIVDHLNPVSGSEKNDQFENTTCDFREAESNSNKGSPAKCNNNNDCKDCNHRTENQDEIETNLNSSKVKDAVINVRMPNISISEESASDNSIVDYFNINGNCSNIRIVDHLDSVLGRFDECDSEFERMRSHVLKTSIALNSSSNRNSSHYVDHLDLRLGRFEVDENNDLVNTSRKHDSAIVNDQGEVNRIESTFSCERNDESSINYQQKLIKNCIGSDSENSTKEVIQLVNNDCQLHVTERIGHISNDEGRELNHKDKTLERAKEVPPVLVTKPNLIDNFNQCASKLHVAERIGHISNNEGRELNPKDNSSECAKEVPQVLVTKSNLIDNFNKCTSKDDKEEINNVMGSCGDLKCKNNSQKFTKSKSTKIVKKNDRGNSHDSIVSKLIQNPCICDEDEIGYIMGFECDESVDELKNNTENSSNIKDKHASENNQELTRLIEKLTEEEIFGRYECTLAKTSKKDTTFYSSKKNLNISQNEYYNKSEKENFEKGHKNSSLYILLINDDEIREKGNDEENHTSNLCQGSSKSKSVVSKSFVASSSNVTTNYSKTKFNSLQKQNHNAFSISLRQETTEGSSKSKSFVATNSTAINNCSKRHSTSAQKQNDNSKTNCTMSNEVEQDIILISNNEINENENNEENQTKGLFIACANSNSFVASSSNVMIKCGKTNLNPSQKQNHKKSTAGKTNCTLSKVEPGECFVLLHRIECEKQKIVETHSNNLFNGISKSKNFVSTKRSSRINNSKRNLNSPKQQNGNKSRASKANEEEQDILMTSDNGIREKENIEETYSNHLFNGRSQSKNFVSTRRSPRINNSKRNSNSPKKQNNNKSRTTKANDEEQDIFMTSDNKIREKKKIEETHSNHLFNGSSKSKNFVSTRRSPRINNSKRNSNSPKKQNNNKSRTTKANDEEQDIFMTSYNKIREKKKIEETHSNHLFNGSSKSKNFVSTRGSLRINNSKRNSNSPKQQNGNKSRASKANKEEQDILMTSDNGIKEKEKIEETYSNHLFNGSSKSKNFVSTGGSLRINNSKRDSNSPKQQNGNKSRASKANKEEQDILMTSDNGIREKEKIEETYSNHLFNGSSKSKNFVSTRRSPRINNSKRNSNSPKKQNNNKSRASEANDEEQDIFMTSDNEIREKKKIEKTDSNNLFNGSFKSKTSISTRSNAKINKNKRNSKSSKKQNNNKTRATKANEEEQDILLTSDNEIRGKEKVEETHSNHLFNGSSKNKCFVPTSSNAMINCSERKKERQNNKKRKINNICNVINSKESTSLMQKMKIFEENSSYEICKIDLNSSHKENNNICVTKHIRRVEISEMVEEKHVKVLSDISSKTNSITQEPEKSKIGKAGKKELKPKDSQPRRQTAGKTKFKKPKNSKNGDLSSFTHLHFQKRKTTSTVTIDSTTVTESSSMRSPSSKRRKLFSVVDYCQELESL